MGCARLAPPLLDPPCDTSQQSALCVQSCGCWYLLHVLAAAAVAQIKAIIRLRVLDQHVWPVHDLMKCSCVETHNILLWGQGQGCSVYGQCFAAPQQPPSFCFTSPCSPCALPGQVVVLQTSARLFRLPFPQLTSSYGSSSSASASRTCPCLGPQHELAACWGHSALCFSREP